MTERKEITIQVTERDYRIIALLARLSDKELFGLECYLVGVCTAQRMGRAAGEFSAGTVERGT